MIFWPKWNIPFQWNKELFDLIFFIHVHNMLRRRWFPAHHRYRHVFYLFTWSIRFHRFSFSSIGVYSYFLAFIVEDIELNFHSLYRVCCELWRIRHILQIIALAIFLNQCLFLWDLVMNFEIFFDSDDKTFWWGRISSCYVY